MTNAHARTLILGAGVTGLAASLDSGAVIIEAADQPGGICRSYYIAAGGQSGEARDKTQSFRFEIGGGHWVFGADEELQRLLSGLCSWRSYERRAAVFFPDTRQMIPFPLQYHLGHLPAGLGRQVLREIEQPKTKPSATLAGWLEQTFGSTLFQLFFSPFNSLYTAGLFTEVAPENEYKNPLDLSLAARSLEADTSPAGYNVAFLYPEGGLDRFCDALAVRSNLRLRERVVRVDCRAKRVLLDGGSSTGYENLISTLPLDHMLRITGIEICEEPDPATSVLVLNLGCVRGPQCPDQHWVYVPQSRSGFHRLGFYSNVDSSFLSEEGEGLVSLYVERAFRRGRRPPPAEETAYLAGVADELREWGWIDSLLVASPSWVETAYT